MTGFNYFRVRNVLFVNTPDVFLLFILMFCLFYFLLSGCCCFSTTLNKKTSNRVRILVWEGPVEESKTLLTAQDSGEVNHENVINQEPRGGCSGVP